MTHYMVPSPLYQNHRGNNAFIGKGIRVKILHEDLDMERNHLPPSGVWQSVCMCVYVCVCVCVCCLGVCSVTCTALCMNMNGSSTRKVVIIKGHLLKYNRKVSII